MLKFINRTQVKRQNVVGVPLLSSKDVYMELNVLVADGKSFGIVKKYVLGQDKKIQLSIYKAPGDLIAQGYYDKESGLFMAGKSPQGKLMGKRDEEDPTINGGTLEEVVIHPPRVQEPFGTIDNGGGGGSFPSYPVGGFPSDNPIGGSGFDPEGGGRGGGSSTTPKPAVADITNNVKDPCLKKMVDDIISKNAATKIGSMIYKIFNESTSPKLTINESSDLHNLTGGTTKPAIENGIFKGATIDLNVNTLPNASKEYIALVILHEGLHAYLNSRTNGNNDLSGKIHHEAMAIIYLDEMAKSLTEMFPDMPRGDAYSLAYEGLHETLTFELNINSVPQLPDTYASINQQYRLAQKGNKCN